MPNLYRVPSFRWGDCLLDSETGKIFSIQKTGTMVIVVGGGDGRDPAYLEGNNDDGKPDSCVPIALDHLKIPDFGSLEKLEKLEFTGEVVDFLRAHPTGKFFVIVERPKGEPAHAFALVDGTAYNLKFGALICKVLEVRQA